MEECFEVRRSAVHGDGLFATRDIPKNTIFDIEVSRSRKARHTYSRDSYILDYYSTDATSLCVQSGRIVEICSLANLEPTVFTPRFVSCKHMAMKANDLAWPAKSSTKYLSQAERKNKMCLLLEISARVIAVKACMIDDIQQGEEVGNTYGYSFWSLPS